MKGVSVPTFIYGTAWKEEHTARLVRSALAAGFRGIDTANQRRHYNEAGVGEALEEALAVDGLSRVQLFLQTKYTFRRGQDHRLLYDPDADPNGQTGSHGARKLRRFHGLSSQRSSSIRRHVGRPALGWTQPRRRRHDVAARHTARRS